MMFMTIAKAWQSSVELHRTQERLKSEPQALCTPPVQALAILSCAILRIKPLP